VIKEIPEKSILISEGGYFPIKSAYFRRKKEKLNFPLRIVADLRL